MLYRENIKNGDKLSALGYGCMRFPSVKKEIDVPASFKLLSQAYEAGVNYFDTAYVYNDGRSEEIVGEGVQEFRREIKLATKLPLMQCKEYADFNRLFNTSLSRLRTDYIDYYLLHCILSFAQYEKMVQLGVNEWIKEKKANGQIVNIGFSFHGPLEDFRRIIDAYDWDFCQIQYNYFDVHYQAGKAGLHYAHQKGLPVIIMEPLRGGALVNKLPQSAQDEFKKFDATRGFADWGLRWLYDQPEVTVVLSGMGNEEMLTTNLATASTATVGDMSKEEKAVIAEVLRKLQKTDRIGCTGCAYCMPCPHGVNIPMCFSSYNSIGFSGRIKGIGDYVTNVGGLSAAPGFASNCKECGRCEKLCPQHIEIIKELKRVKRTFEIPLFKPILKIVKKKR